MQLDYFLNDGPVIESFTADKDGAYTVRSVAAGLDDYCPVDNEPWSIHGHTDALLCADLIARTFSPKGN